MGEQAVGGWFAMLVLLAIVAGIVLAFWFFGVLNTPTVPQ
jgi:hypothetical protein